MKAIQEQVNGMLQRSLALHGLHQNADGQFVNLDESVKTFMRELASQTPDPKEQVKLLTEAWDAGPDSDKMRELCSIRVEQVSNFIFSESVFMSAFFEQITLKDDEQPYVENETEQEINVGMIGEDGLPDQVRVVKPGSRTPIALNLIASKWVKYKLMDVYKGNVSNIATKTFDIARDLTFQLDATHRTLLTSTVANGGCFGAFSTEQSRANKATRIYLPHSGIVTAHLPTTNDFVNSDVQAFEVTGTTGFRPAVLALIESYGNKWANVLPGGGRLIPTGEIIVPSSDIVNIAKGAAPESGKTENQLQAEINRNGFTTLSYLGRQWKFIADVTIAAGTCFPRFNMLPGLTYTKSIFNKEFVETNQPENWERRRQQKLYGAYIICQRRPRAIRVKYIA